MGKSTFRIIFMISTTLLIFNTLCAQTFDLQSIPSDKKQFGVSYNRPFYKNSFDISTFSGVYQLSMNIPVSSKLNIIGNIPFIATSYSINYGYGEYNYSENGLGNIFIGMQTNIKPIDNKKSIFTFGLYVPTASEKAAFNGAIADYYYMSKYNPNSLGIYFNYAFHKLNAEGLKYGFEIGPNLMIPTKGNGAETEFLAHYGIIGGYQIKQITLSLEFVGVVIISEDIQKFEDRFVNMLNIGAQWDGGIVKPMIYYKYYLRKEIRQTIDGVLGIGVNVVID